MTMVMFTLREARVQFFAENRFPADGGDSQAWVDFKVGPVPLPFPNSDARRRAVRYHDLHHVLTGYRATVIGELEIAAWELAAGCGTFAAAWVINLAGLLAGLLAAPKRVWAAFVRGRRSSSLYSQPFEPLLERDVNEVRAAQGLCGPPSRGTALDALVLLATVMLGLLVWVPVALLTPVIIVPWFIGGRRYLQSLRQL